MATFTTELRKAVEMEPGILTRSLTEYPIFDEGYREGLNQKILDHFWNREVGQETPSMFAFALRRKMNEIMPLYNLQYEASRIKFDPLQTVNVRNLATTTGTTATAGESVNNSTSGAKSRAVAQELPQTMLADNGDYATSAQNNTSETTAGGKVNESSNVAQDATTDNTTTGFQGNPAMMILQYRQSLVNVDMMVIDELETLFMLIWSNGDEFTERGNSLDYYFFG